MNSIESFQKSALETPNKENSKHHMGLGNNRGSTVSFDSGGRTSK